MKMSIQKDLFNITTTWKDTSNSPDLQSLSKWTMIIYAITVLLGVPGNSAVIWVRGFKMERNIHPMSFLYLAVANLIYCLTLPFWMVNVALRGSWIRDDILYMLPLGSIVFNGTVSVFMLALISIFRCLAVTRPIWFHQHNRLRWVHVAFFGVCAFSILICMTALLYIKFKPNDGPKVWEMIRVIWAVFIFVLPVMIMTGCCAVIGRRLHRDKFSKSRKPVRLIVALVAAFIASWLRLHSCSFAMLIFNSSFLAWNDVATAVACFNSALNPFYYIFTGRDFRQGFRLSLSSSLRLAFSEEEPGMLNDPPNRTTTL